MEKIFKLQDRPSPFIRELRLYEETKDGGIYIPFTNGMIRIIGDIKAIDFDGGPFMTAGYKLNEHNTVESIYRQNNEIFVKVKKELKMGKEKFYYSEDKRVAVARITYDGKGNVLSVNKLYDEYRKPRVTICGIYDKEAQTMSYGVAKCSSLDEFSKKRGQQISYARAVNKPCLVVSINKDDKVSKVYMKYAKQLEEEALS